MKITEITSRINLAEETAQGESALMHMMERIQADQRRFDSLTASIHAAHVSRLTGISGLIQGIQDQSETLRRLTQMPCLDGEIKRVTDTVAGLARLSDATSAALTMFRTPSIGTELSNSIKALNAAAVTPSVGLLASMQWPRVANGGFDFSSFHEKMSGISRLNEMFERWRRESETLDASGYSFLINFLDNSFAAHIYHLDDSRRQTEVDERMWKITRDPKFRTIMRRVFATHPDLDARWPAVSQGLSAHKQGHFHASVRTLLPEAEGILTQIMVAVGQAELRSGHYYALDPSGAVARHPTHGYEIKLNGLGAKVGHCKPHEDSVLRWVISRYLRDLPNPRNKTLHGQDNKMGNSQFSTRLVWGVYALCFGAAAELIARDIEQATGADTEEARQQAEERLEKGKSKIHLSGEVFQMEL